MNNSVSFFQQSPLRKMCDTIDDKIDHTNSSPSINTKDGKPSHIAFTADETIRSIVEKYAVEIVKFEEFEADDKLRHSIVCNIHYLGTLHNLVSSTFEKYKKIMHEEHKKIILNKIYKKILLIRQAIISKIVSNMAQNSIDLYQWIIYEIKNKSDKQIYFICQIVNTSEYYMMNEWNKSNNYIVIFDGMEYTVKYVMDCSLLYQMEDGDDDDDVDVDVDVDVEDEEDDISQITRELNCKVYLDTNIDSI